MQLIYVANLPHRTYVSGQEWRNFLCVLKDMRVKCREVIRILLIREKMRIVRTKALQLNSDNVSKKKQA